MTDATGLLSAVVEWILPTLGALGLVRLAWRPGEGVPSLLRSDRAAWALWLLTRPAYAVLLWCFLDPGFGADMWHWDRNTRSMDQGMVIGRDFPNYYSPLLPYLQYAGRWLTPGFDRVGTLWIFLAGDALAVFLGGRLLGGLLGERAGAWARAWLLLDPLLWHQGVVRAQDEGLFLGTLVASVWLLRSGRFRASMAVLAAGLCATKIVYAPYALAVLLALPGEGRPFLRWWGWWGLAAGALCASYLATGASLFSGVDLEMRVRNWGAGVSAPDAARRIVPELPFDAALVLYAAACAVLVPWGARRFRAHPPHLRAVLNLAVAHAASLLFMPCAVSPYLAQGALFLLAAVLASRLGPVERRVAVLWLAAVSWLAAMFWTRHPAFSVLMKPVCISLHAGALLLLLHRGGAAAAPARGSP